jgi:hypothetical protein
VTGRFIPGCHGKTQLICVNRMFDFAGGVIFQTDAQLSCDEQAGDIGIG